MHGRSEVGHRRAAARPVANAHLQAAETILLRRVVVFSPSMARGFCRLAVSLDQRVFIFAALYTHRAVTATLCAGPALPGFLTLEVRQHMRVVPLRQAIAAGPSIKVVRIAAHIGHGIGR